MSELEDANKELVEAIKRIKSKQKWEYKVLSQWRGDLQEGALNSHAQDGWELVTAIKSGSTTLLYLKRKLKLSADV